MPTYDYRCTACGHELEVFQSISDGLKRKCPSCGKPKLERQIGAGAGVLFKGGGFYQTDYRSDSYKKAEGAEKGGTSAPEPAASTSESKPAADAPREKKSAADAPREKKPASDKSASKKKQKDE